MAGKCWLIGAGATAEWAGKQSQIAYWDGGGWQYIIPLDGMRLYNKANNAEIAYKSGIWASNMPVADAAGGSVVDMEARNSVNQLLFALRNIGILPV